jgi:hypothetical protein
VPSISSEVAHIESRRHNFDMDTAESEARKALNRLRRALEKAEREFGALEGALVHAEGDDFPTDEYAEVAASLTRLLDFTEEEGTRLQEKILHAGGLEPGRVRRG